MYKMTEDNCKIGDQKVMTNTKGAPKNLFYTSLCSFHPRHEDLDMALSLISHHVKGKPQVY